MQVVSNGLMREERLTCWNMERPFRQNYKWQASLCPFHERFFVGPWSQNPRHHLDIHPAVRRTEGNGGGGSWGWQADEQARAMWEWWTENHWQPSSLQGTWATRTPFLPSLPPHTPTPDSCPWPNENMRCAFQGPDRVALLWSKEGTAYVLSSQ